MKIKTKLRLGLGLLFLLIVTLSAISIWNVTSMKRDTEMILKSNYNTLAYSKEMLKQLDNIPERPEALSLFSQNLDKQLKNVTEAGEKPATESLRAHFEQLKIHPEDRNLRVMVRSDIIGIMQLNMDAISSKSKSATTTAEEANVWIGTSAGLCFLIAFTLLVNLPENIGNPIRELTRSIKEISARNYKQRVHFEGNSEFGELAQSFNIMAEKLDEFAGTNLSKLLMEKKRIETLINNMHDPVIGLDGKQHIIFANEVASKIIGLPKHEMLNKSLLELALHNDLLRMLAFSASAPLVGSKKSDPIKIYANGRESFFEKEVININIIPTGENEEMNIGYVILLRNITPFRELDLAKTNFIATVSHELKTPIAAIKLSLQLLNNDSTGILNGEQLQLLSSIGEDSDRLLKITGELLDMSQVETGNIQLNIRRSIIHPIIKYAIETTRTAAESKQLAILVNASEDLPLVKADPEKTTWVLTNFLSNAIRYSPEHGSITINVSVENEKIAVSVKDDGRGIDSRYLSRIFERYFQIPGSNRSGSGLGLAISKEFIEAQGGSIGVESSPGMGSTFYFYLPT